MGDGYLARQQPLCQGVAAPAASSAPEGGTSTGAAPLRTGCRRTLPLLAIGDSSPCGRRFYPQALPLRTADGVHRLLRASLASLAGYLHSSFSVLDHHPTPPIASWIGGPAMESQEYLYKMLLHHNYQHLWLTDLMSTIQDDFSRKIPSFLSSSLFSTSVFSTITEGYVPIRFAAACFLTLWW
ncbi:hypothetical protein GW17_00061226 [Ensete ventricosum]|nr:hypothetical protein GW17_00061226 [Ensete ventricosum]